MKKLIISIDEKIYEKALKNRGTDKSLDDMDKLSLEVALEEGTPLEEELEKIKGYNDHILNCGMGKKKSIEFINKFIEHRISELEGDEYEPDDWDSLANAERDH